MKPQALQSTRALSASIGKTQLRRDLAQGDRVRIRHGWTVPSSSWTDELQDARHLLRVHASAGSMRGARQVYSYYSAAVLHALPTVRIGDPHVHVTSASRVKTRTTDDVRRHADALSADDVVEVDGLACTSIERTVFDVARASSAECAIAIVDAALRRVAWDDATHEYDEDAAERWRRRMMHRISTSGGVRGTRQLRWAIGFGDGRAQLPGESISRMRLWQLGFATPRLQVAVPSPHGGFYYVDEALDDVEAWLEFDGEVKYTDADMLAGRTADQVLADQRRRQEWICEVSGRPMVRCGWSALDTPQTFSRHLRAFGIRPPR